MKRPLLTAVICSVVSFLFTPAFSQQDSTYQDPDSVLNQFVHTTPYDSNRSLEACGTFGVVAANPLLSHAYAGISVLNMLRGQAPSLSLSPAVVYTEGAGFRGTETMVAIDGMPYQSDITDFYNLNAFEFGSITAIANPNTGFSYGAIGMRGGVFLKSKTGENISSPSFEFNSYTSRDLACDDSPDYYGSRHSTWSLSNSLAYSQDYGAVDLRASYNFLSNPYSPDDLTDGFNRAHAIKLNGGLDLGKFTVRLIGDFRRQNFLSETEFPTSTRSVFKKSTGFLQGNLNVQYKFNDWIKLTSQHVSSTSDFDSYSDASFGSTQLYSEQPRRLHNLIISVDKPVTRLITLRSFAGAQLDRMKWTRRSVGGASTMEQRSEIDNTALFAGLGGDLAEILFIDLNYRRDQYSLFPDDKAVNTWGASTSFVFSRILSKDPGKFSGKIRSYVGKTNNDYILNYPAPSIQSNGAQIPTSPRRNFEIGADVGFVQNRVTLSSSYYKNVTDDLWAIFNSPSGPNFLNIGEFHYTGYEFVAGVIPVRTGRTSWSSKIVFYKNKAEIESEGGSSGGNGSLSLGNPIPNWQGSLFNQFQHRGIFLNILLDVRSGGDFYLYDFTSTPLGVIDGSYTKFRDITLGYSFQQSILDNLKLTSAHLSLSGRNLIQFNDKDKDAERYSYGSQLRSLSLSISVSF